MNNAITTHDLTKRFGKLTAVDNLTLAVPEGSIFAFLGPNGAGKTTTIKLLLNLVMPDEGQSEIFGIKTARLGPTEFAQIGYVSENQNIYDWMTVKQLKAFCKPMYPTWDDAFCGRLIKQFDLPLERRISSFSRGMRIKTVFLISLAYRPRLLILDEPFTGLDPLVRDELIQGILELTTTEHWTVFISSHDIYEVEMLADTVGLLDRGKLKLIASLDSLQARFKKVNIALTSPLTCLPNLPSTWMAVEHENRAVKFIDIAYQEKSSPESVYRLFPGCTNIKVTGMTLREIFIALAKTYKSNNTEGQ